MFRTAYGKYLIVLFSAAALISGLGSCKKKDGPQPEEETSFDKQVMLVNLADQVILPSYKSFDTALDSVVIAFNRFRISEETADLRVVRERLTDAYLKYQHVSLHGFGPGEDLSIRNNFNIFPCDTAKIKNNAASGSSDLSMASNLSAKGLPALEYMFFSRSEAGTTELFKDLSYKNYASKVLLDMTTQMKSLLGTWNNSYRNTFCNSLGTDVGSSIGYVINQINFELDYLKNSKIATPLGLRSAGAIRPRDCEAYYSAKSNAYALETLLAIENVYRGRSNSGVDGIGFDDYVSHLNISYGEITLAAAINSQFAVAKEKLKNIPAPLSVQVQGDKAPVDAAYRELVKLLVLLKTDLPSGLGVVITYQDGDGD